MRTSAQLQWTGMRLMHFASRKLAPPPALVAARQLARVVAIIIIHGRRFLVGPGPDRPDRFRRACVNTVGS